MACSGSDNGSSTGSNGGGLKVIATTTQIGDFARDVGGDRIDLDVLVSPNQDVHDFQLEPSQIRAISDADVVLRNGLQLDAFLDKALANSDATVATLSEGISTQQATMEDEHKSGSSGANEGADPHIWFSVANAKHMVENLRDALVAADPDDATFYQDNATSYLQQLDQLDAQIHDQVAAVPEACRKLVTNHDVLGYYASAYGFQLIGSVIPSTSSEAQSSAGNVADIVQAIKDQHVPAIFAEASINPDLIQQVGREAGVTVVDDLYGDSLGPPDSDGATYIGMMGADTQKITEALKNCID
jgi:zinc/manganese transport system substrate-binding protein/manganese/iron transport system substrate-binding protein